MFSTFAVSDVLKDYRKIHIIDDSDRIVYKGVSLLLSKAQPVQPYILYVCPLSLLPDQTGSVTNCHYVCVCDLPEEEADKKTALRTDLFCVGEEYDLSILFSELFNRFLFLQEWISRLNQIILEDCDIQKIVDETEEVLRNPLYVYDASFHLIAKSKKIVSSGSPWLEEYNNGSYHSADFVRELEKKGRMKLYNQTDDLLVITDHLMEPYDIVGKWKRRDGVLALSAGMSCQYIPVTPYSKELCSVFCDYVFLCEDKQHAVNPSSVKQSFRLFREILDQTLQTPSSIEERARSLSVPFNGPFILYRMVFYTSSNIFMKRICRDLEEKLGKAVVNYLGDEVLVLDRCDDFFSDPDLLPDTKIIAAEAADRGGKCYISEPFETLADFSCAYVQTEQTKKLLEELAMTESALESSFVKTNDYQERTHFTYRDIFFRYLYSSFMSQHSSAVEGVVFVRAIRRLLEYDKEHGKNLAEILYHYIRNERNASKTASLVFMSRNNVLYHISKASEILDMPLDDPDIRHGLMVSYHLLGIY